MRSDSSSSDEDTTSPSTPKKKQKIRHELPKDEQKSYKQKFTDKWLNDPQFKNWIQQTNNPLKVLCKVCNATLVCGKSELSKHANTQKHLRLIRGLSNVKTIDSFCCQKKNDKNTKDSQIKSAEIHLSYYFAEHNVAVSCVDHLVPLLKRAIPDSEILKEVRLKRTKCTGIIKNVIAKHTEEKLVSILKSVRFSILIDESTDISMNKLLCIVVKYVTDNFQVTTQLLQCLSIDASDCSSQKLYDAFMKCIEEKNIPVKNIIGFASDNASVMVGCNNSFQTKLTADVDVLMSFPCICHSAALVANKACLELPRSPEDLVRNIATYFATSSKRQVNLKEMQEFFMVETKKIIKLSATRWLCLQHCVNRILTNWDCLKNYFRVAVFEDKLKVSEFIHEQLNNDVTKIYLLFMNFVLNLFNNFNALFQSDTVLIHRLSDECSKLFKQLIINFIKPECIHIHVNVNDPNNYVVLEEVHLGPKTNELIKTIPNNIAEDIRKKCLSFYIVATKEIRNRFPIEDKFVVALAFLDPKRALSENRENIKLNVVLEKFKKIIDKDEVEVEWRTLPYSFSEEEKTDLKVMEIQKFWDFLYHYKEVNEEYKFRNLCKLVKLVLCAPHSNAETERIFSVCTDVKNKKRNKIGPELLNSITLIRSEAMSCIPRKDCTNFQIEEQHLRLMNSSNIYN